MINEPAPFTGFNIRIPSKIPINGRGFIHQGSGLSPKPSTIRVWATIVLAGNYTTMLEVIPLGSHTIQGTMPSGLGFSGLRA